MSNIELIQEKINKIHGGDEKQLEIVFSEDNRVIVEAPAGYGKTATMISRMAYLYSMGLIPNPKKVLALTFSVNAALKIKREVAEKLPYLINENNNPNSVSERMTITNYHGICKNILNKYGYLITSLLKLDLHRINIIGEGEIEKVKELNLVSSSSICKLKKINEKIISAEEITTIGVREYNEIVISELLPHGYMTHNSVILLTIELFDKYPKIQRFYNEYYPLIVVDEFQDTNYIAWELLNRLISDKTKLLFLGDSLQRIYGFIGAIPSIMSKSEADLRMKKITLEKNYRFKDNIEMLRLDKAIRKNALSCFEPIIDDEAELPTLWAKDQVEEAEKVLKKVRELKSKNPSCKITVLFRGRGDNSAVFEEVFVRESEKYFYGMFKDDDIEYVNFHRYCLSRFIKRFGNQKSIGKKSLLAFVESVKKKYKSVDEKIALSLLGLLDAFVKKIETDYPDLNSEDKYNLIYDTLENKQLKQAMEYVDVDLIFCTIHGAKGLEWPYVFLTDFERYGLPSAFTCKDCDNKNQKPQKCVCPFPKINENNKENMIDELSVFYVAATRAKRQFYISASAIRGTGKNGCLSCFSRLKGINIVNAEK